MIKLAPSILTANVGRLAEQVQEAAAAGADYIHLDVMDGHFVPVISLGPLFVAAVRKAVAVPLDIHLMVEEPERHIAAFRDAGGDILNVHVEACAGRLHETLAAIKRLGAKAGVCLNPATPLSAIEEVLGEIDQVMVMAVNPGWGGQSFIDSVLAKIERLCEEKARRGLEIDIEVDGGINVSTAPRCVAAGANVIVAGSAVYNDKAPIAENIRALRKAIAARIGE